MANLDLSGLTTAELETMKTALLASHTRSLSSKKYKIGSRENERDSSKEILEQIACVAAELNARTDTTGGIALAEFDEQT